MPVQYNSINQKTYYLHQGKTRTGKPKYFFSTKAEGNLVEFLPDGYEIYENPNAQVFLIKEVPKVISDAEKAIVEEQLKDVDSARSYRIDVKGKTITIFESIHERTKFYTPMMRFTLEDEGDRTFVAERYCFRGSVDDWIYIGGSGPLALVTSKFIPHLGKESLFELY